MLAIGVKNLGSQKFLCLETPDPDRQSDSPQTQMRSSRRCTFTSRGVDAWVHLGS